MTHSPSNPTGDRGAGWIFVAIAFRHLLRHRLRAAMTLMGVALGVAVAVAVQLANGSAVSAFEGSVAALAGEARWSVQAQGGPLDERVLARLLPLTEDGTLAPVVEGLALLAGHPDQVLHVVGIDALAADRGASQDVDGLVVTARGAERLGVTTGARLPLWVGGRRVEVPVAGILKADARSQGIDPMTAFCDLAVAQELLGRVGTLDRVELAAGHDEAGFLARARGLLKPGEALVEPGEAQRTSARMLQAFRTNLGVLSVVALVVGAYLIYNTVAVSVVQRRAEIATLRALGTTRQRIFLLFALEAGVLGLVGALVGMPLGAGMARLALTAIGRTVNAHYLAAPVGGVVYAPAAFASGLAVGVGLALVAAVVPALDAAGTPPALAMRPGSWEARQRGGVGKLAIAGLLALALSTLAMQGPAVDDMPVCGYLALLLVIAGCSLLSPLAVVGVARLGSACAAGRPIGTLAARNLARSVGRSGGAVAALMVGLAFAIGVATLVGSFRASVAHWVAYDLPASLYVQPLVTRGARIGEPLPADLAPKLAALPGLAATEAFRDRYVGFHGVNLRLRATDAGVMAAHGALVPRSTGTSAGLYRSLVGDDAILASEALAIKHGVRVGDRLTLPTAEGPHAFRVTGLFLDYVSDQGFLVLDRATYRRWWHDDAVTGVALYARPGADLAALRGGVVGAIAGRPVRVADSEEMRAEVMQVFDNTFAITYALHGVAIAVSLLGVVSTLFALVLERQREIGLLRYLGMTRGQIRRLIVVESGLMGLAGAVMGLVGGALLSVVLVEVINRQSFGWTIEWHLPWGFVAATVLGLLATAMLAGLYPASVAARTRIAEGLRDA